MSRVIILLLVLIAAVAATLPSSQSYRLPTVPFDFRCMYLLEDEMTWSVKNGTCLIKGSCYMESDWDLSVSPNMIYQPNLQYQDQYYALCCPKITQSAWTYVVGMPYKTVQDGTIYCPQKMSGGNKMSGQD